MQLDFADICRHHPGARLCAARWRVPKAGAAEGPSGARVSAGKPGMIGPLGVRGSTGHPGLLRMPGSRPAVPPRLSARHASLRAIGSHRTSGDHHPACGQWPSAGSGARCFGAQRNSVVATAHSPVHECALRFRIFHIENSGTERRCRVLGSGGRVVISRGPRCACQDERTRCLARSSASRGAGVWPGTRRADHPSGWLGTASEPSGPSVVTGPREITTRPVDSGPQLVAGPFDSAPSATASSPVPTAQCTSALSVFGYFISRIPERSVDAGHWAVGAEW